MSDIPSEALTGNPEARSLVRFVESGDVDELAPAFARWNQTFEQLQGGPFRGWLRLLDREGVQIVEIGSNRVVRARGARPDHSFVFTPVTDLVAGAHWRGRELAAGMVNVLSPESEMDHRTCSDYRNTSLIVPRDRLERVARIAIGVDLDRVLDGERPIRIPPPRASRLVSDFGKTLLDSLLADGSTSRSPSDPDDWILNLIAALAEGRVADPVRATCKQRIAAVRKVEEYVRAFPERRVGVVELCALAGVGKRTLHYAFVEVTGQSPKAYIKTIKLNAARRDLRAIGPGPGHVAAVARRYGFDRPGNFAADFRRLFGESPSKYLSRRGPY